MQTPGLSELLPRSPHSTIPAGPGWYGNLRNLLRYAEQVRAVGRVMDFARARAVLDYWDPVWFVVADDVGGVEEFSVLKRASRAPRHTKHPLLSRRSAVP